jgi:cytoskeletal protein RodZ
MRPDDSSAGSLGEILQRARLTQGLSLDQVEQATHISRRYLEALEQEHFSVLPAPVYARGFLRTYASFLGLEPAQLMPLFPVSYLDQPAMQPLPKVDRPPVWSASWLVAAGIVGFLVLIIALLYAFAGGNESGLLQSPLPELETSAPSSPQVTSTPVAQVDALPDLRGRNSTQAIEILQQLGLNYAIFETFSDQVPAGQVIEQSPATGTRLQSGQVVTLVISRGRRP